MLRFTTNAGVLKMPDLLYLDYNCFQRGFDDSSQVRIRMEAAACEKIFDDAESGVVDLVWSFMTKTRTICVRTMIANWRLHGCPLCAVWTLPLRKR